MIKYKIRGFDWLTFPLIIVNFNHFFIQPGPGGTNDMDTIEYATFRCDTVEVENRLERINEQIICILGFATPS